MLLTYCAVFTGCNIEQCVRQALRLAGGSAASETAGLEADTGEVTRRYFVLRCRY